MLEQIVELLLHLGRRVLAALDHPLGLIAKLVHLAQQGNRVAIAVQRLVRPLDRLVLRALSDEPAKLARFLVEHASRDRVWGSRRSVMDGSSISAGGRARTVRGPVRSRCTATSWYDPFEASASSDERRSPRVHFESKKAACSPARSARRERSRASRPVLRRRSRARAAAPSHARRRQLIRARRTRCMADSRRAPGRAVRRAARAASHAEIRPAREDRRATNAAFRSATSRASRDTSVAMTRWKSPSVASASAIAPDPVPTSTTRASSALLGLRARGR